ncbi:ABC transporter permease [Candidatus Bipolaricaulota bacterium]
MNDAQAIEQTASLPQPARREWLRTVGRCLRYLATRGVTVFLTILVGIYAAIWVTNLGGFGDKARRDEIRIGIVMYFNQTKWYHELPLDERTELLETATESAFVANDLDQPFVLRSFRYFRQAFSLSLGMTTRSFHQSVPRPVRDVLIERVPMTLLMFGTANLITFFAGLFIALGLSRRYGSALDRVTTLLVPVFAAPSWFHGIFLIVIFASLLKILPFGGIVDASIPDTTFLYALSMLRHMILPVAAVVLGTLPFAVYANRALFLIHSNEDYVELAKAKGLGARRLQRRYILRPVLPPVITNFAFIAIVAWQGIILTEEIFSWPGLGSLLIEAIHSYSVSLVIGTIVMFAYLMGASFLLLDVLYVLVDPRVTLGVGGRK